MNRHKYPPAWQVLWTSWVRLRRGWGGLRIQARRTKALSGGRRHFCHHCYHPHHCHCHHHHHHKAKVDCWVVSLCDSGAYLSTNNHYLLSPTVIIVIIVKSCVVPQPADYCHNCQDHRYQIMCRPSASWLLSLLSWSWLAIPQPTDQPHPECRKGCDSGATGDNIEG